MMKKLLYMLFLLPLAFFASCSDDDDLPQVDLTVTLSGVTQVGNTFYAVQDTEEATPQTDENTPEVSSDVVRIDGVSVKSLNGKNSAVTGVRYFLDTLPIFSTIENPFTYEFAASDLKVGKHVISVTATILQEDKSIASAAVNLPLVVVENESDLPADAPAIGTYSSTVRLDAK